MNVMVIGSGGREHALVWRLSQSSLIKKLYCAPGNPGTARYATNLPTFSTADLKQLADFAKEQHIDLTIVGPEAPLCAGIQDVFAAEGLNLMGPSALAARLEGSKVFAKQFMQRHAIPTASFGVFDDFSSAATYLDHHPEALVVKADGLAAGKGVVVCSSVEEAKQTVKSILAGRLGPAGKQIIVERLLQGEEVSLLVLTDGERYLPWPGCQDHKRLNDKDEGPNTGGMGAYSPIPLLDEGLQQKILNRVVAPTIAGMAMEGCPYRGILYIGLMIVGEDFYVLEYNCRLGDPETQPLMMRVKSDLIPYFQGAAQGQLPASPLEWDPRSALCVVMSSSGYPGTYSVDVPIEGIEKAEAIEDVMVFHAGTAWKHNQLVTASGRVLGVTALGDTLRETQKRAYQAVEAIHWSGAHYRKDIGYRALAS